ncbi:MAG: hypothetical protein ACLFN8_05175 [Candidatus Woesearchaeota archaeon]
MGLSHEAKTNLKIAGLTAILVGGGVGFISHQIYEEKASRLRTQNQRLITENHNLKDENTKTGRELSAVNENYEQTQEKLTELQTAYTKTRANLGTKIDLNKDLQYKKDSLISTLDATELLLEDANKREDSLINIVLTDLRNTLSDTKDALVEYKNKTKELTDSLNNTNNELNATQERLHHYGLKRWFVNPNNFNEDAIQQMPQSTYDTREERRDNRRLYRQLRK